MKKIVLSLMLFMVANAANAIQVILVSGLASWIALTTGTTWVASPSADNLRIHNFFIGSTD